MNLNEFEDEISREVVRLKLGKTEWMREVMRELGFRVVARCPVLSGQLISNWFTSLDKPLRGYRGPEKWDHRGNVSLEDLYAVTEALTPQNKRIFFTNSLPYVNRIEFEAWSKQAPAGMVRVTVAEFPQFAKANMLRVITGGTKGSRKVTIK